ncbi:hypothetical protein, partial [Dyadobacter sp. SG02]|uniref:hypothetical protein n=1 Tax=Dyadobacter sp. SG02 TaxID=1855291 RepID=UPI001C42F919
YGADYVPVMMIHNQVKAKLLCGRVPNPLSLQDMMSKHSKTPFKRFKRGFCVFGTYQKMQEIPMKM